MGTKESVEDTDTDDSVIVDDYDVTIKEIELTLPPSKEFFVKIP